MFDLMPFSRRNVAFFDPFDNMMGERFFKDANQAVAECKADIIDQGEYFMIEAELPGFDREDIHLNLDGDYLTISAEHSEEKKDEGKNFVRRERYVNNFLRHFNVADIKVEEIAAEYKNGILEVKLPKRGESVPQNKQIEIK